MRWALVAFLIAGLAACSPSESDGPDEFGVVPALPLEQPENYTDLPTPTPGSGNRTDIRPDVDTASALGGALRDPGVPASDAAVVTFASRFGVDPTIRGELFAADEALRTRRTRFGRGGGEGLYFRIYAPQTLDAYRELERFRSSGVQVPTAPPAR